VTGIIETRGLTKLFAGDRGVRDIHLQVGRGQVFGFLGPNGAGKSTFVKMLVGLLRPTAGEASVLGLPIGDLGARRRIGYLPELFRYQAWLTAEEVLRFHGRLCRMDASHIEKRIQEVTSAVGLARRAQERVQGYSKGMQQRLGLACALLPEPEVLFLDEPASALDPGGRREVRQLLLQLRDEGMTVFLNTHLLEDVEAVCSDVALLMNGRIRAQGTVTDILQSEPVWEFTIGGWTPDLSMPLQERVAHLDVGLKVGATDEQGVTVLEATLQDSEQAAWLNATLHELGVSVYTVYPRQHRLESWFMTLTETQGGEAK
jgi:ABC-2 type transport system ATP-binding protein